MPPYKSRCWLEIFYALLSLKFNVMDIKLDDLPLLMIQPFQDTGSLELEEKEKGCEWCCL